jgi:16S rRNA (guanine966-N2)-methyltransferase
MRISAGEHRGRRLSSPKGSKTRPTSDLLRQAIFNVLGPAIRGVRVLDLFAGTGALGLEALSRGAAAATFVERDRRALSSLHANIREMDFTSRARVLAGDVLAVLSQLNAAGEQFDCVLVDPPYASDLGPRALEVLAPGLILSENAVLVLQAFHKSEFPERVGVLSQFWHRRYGESRVTVYHREIACR